MNEVPANRFLIDAKEFRHELEQRIANATDRILIQVMTFECDEVGNWLLDCVEKSSAQEKVLIADGYSLVNVNDGLAFGPRYFSSKEFRLEVKATRKLLKMKSRNELEIQVTNRIGLNPFLYPFRNHKKLIVIDDVLYLGGLNFSDHNFEWHDFLVRVESKDVVDAAIQDIQQTRRNTNQSKTINCESADLFFLNGNRSKEQYESLFRAITSAEKSIKIISPYISDPLLSLLKCMQNVKVDVITPEVNNKGIMTKLLLSKAQGTDWNIHFYQDGMSHAKGILIDDERLIMGSSNFDFVSYELEQEIVLVTEEDSLVDEFLRRVWIPDLTNSKIDLQEQKRYNGARFVIFVAGVFIKFLGLFKKG